MQAEHILGCGF